MSRRSGVLCEIVRELTCVTGGLRIKSCGGMDMQK